MEVTVIYTIKKMNSGSWSDLEDSWCNTAVKEHGKNFQEIAKAVGTRTEQQVRSRHTKLSCTYKMQDKTGIATMEVAGMKKDNLTRWSDMAIYHCFEDAQVQLGET